MCIWQYQKKSIWKCIVMFGVRKLVSNSVSSYNPFTACYPSIGCLYADKNVLIDICMWLSRTMGVGELCLLIEGTVYLLGYLCLSCACIHILFLKCGGVGIDRLG